MKLNSFTHAHIFTSVKIHLMIPVIIALFFVFTFKGNGGNAHFDKVYVPAPKITLGLPIFVQVMLANSENYPVRNINIIFRIMNILTQQFVFQYKTTIPQLNQKSQMDLSSEPESWTPKESGNYKLYLSLSSTDDIDPSDNELEYDFEVMEPPPTNITIEQLSFGIRWKGQFSNVGMLGYGYGPFTEPKFLNVVAELPGLAKRDWIVQNMPLLPFPRERLTYYWFDFSPLGSVSGTKIDKLNISYQLSDDIITEAFTPKKWYTYSVADVVYNVASDNNEVPESPVLKGSSAPIVWKTNKPITWVYRGCDIPNIDLDQSRHPSSATWSGDFNACGPAAASNSIQWLEDKNPQIKPTGTQQRNKMEKLAKHMNRANNAGVSNQQLVQGKLGYIDDNKLPIHVKYFAQWDTAKSYNSPIEKWKHKADNMSDSAKKPPTWEFLRSEMEKGEDVEIMFGWFDSAGNRNNGHWITVTGVSDVGTAKGIYFKDDINQLDSGGTRETYVNWVDGTGARAKWSRLRQLRAEDSSYSKYDCWVEAIVSESYDSSITYAVSLPKIKTFDFFGSFLKGIKPKALLSFKFKPDNKLTFVNIKLKNNKTGVVSWIARNIALPIVDPAISTAEQELGLWFDLKKLGITSLDKMDSLSYSLVESDSPLLSGFEMPYINCPSVEKIGFNVKSGSTGFDNVALSPFDAEFPAFSQETGSGKYFGTDYPNIDLDNSKYNSQNEPGYAGDFNACGPAAAANALEWIEAGNDISSGTDLRKKATELSTFAGRNKDEGETIEDYIKSKLEFIDNYKLKISTKFQCFKLGTDDINSPVTMYAHFAENNNTQANASPNWDWLTGEISADRSVQMELGYYGNGGTRLGGHWVSVVGTHKSGDAKGIYFMDDIDQGAPGGEMLQFAYWIDKGGFAYLSELSSNEAVCWIESIVSSGYDESIDFSSEVNDNQSTDLALIVDNNPCLAGDDLGIRFILQEPKYVSIDIYNILGIKVKSLFEGYADAGVNTLRLSATVPAGIYFVRLQSGGQNLTASVIKL